MLRYIFIFCFLIPLSGISQDTIVNKKGEMIPAKVMEVTTVDVRYKKSDNPDGPVYIISKDEVSQIKYGNGTSEDIQPAPQPEVIPPVIIAEEPKQELNISDSAEITPEQMYIKGAADARLHYTDYKKAVGLTFAASVLCPCLGLVPAILSTNSNPKTENLGFPDPALMKNKDYTLGYTSTSRERKSSKVWTHFGIGTALFVGLVLIFAGNK